MAWHALTILEKGLAASFGTRFTERTMGCGVAGHSLLLISCATQMRAVDSFYSLLEPDKLVMF
jgi:hypothetical protein